MKHRVFATETATRMVAEDTAAGEDIGAPVVATDVDERDTLTYTLDDIHAAFFAIDGDRAVANRGFIANPWTMKPRPTMR